MEKPAGIERRLCKTTRANWGSVWSPADVWGYEKTGRHIVCLPVLKAGSRPPGQARITNRVPSISTRLTIQVMYTFWTKPATTKPTTQTQATVST